MVEEAEMGTRSLPFSRSVAAAEKMFVRGARKRGRREQMCGSFFFSGSGLLSQKKRNIMLYSIARKRGTGRNIKGVEGSRRWKKGTHKPGRSSQKKGAK